MIAGKGIGGDGDVRVWRRRRSDEEIDKKCGVEEEEELGREGRERRKEGKTTSLRAWL